MIPAILNIRIPASLPSVSGFPGQAPMPGVIANGSAQCDSCGFSNLSRGLQPVSEGFSGLLQGLNQNFNTMDPITELVGLMYRLLEVLTAGSSVPANEIESGVPENSVPDVMSKFRDDILGAGNRDSAGGNSESPSSSARSALKNALQGSGTKDTPLSNETFPSPPSEKPAGTNIRSQNAAQPVDAPTTNKQGNRSRASYDSVIDQFDVANNPRYAQRDTTGDGVTDTFCNIFVSDVTRAMGAEIPHWWKGRELNANATCDWLKNEGGKYGWKPVSEKQAQELANQGKPVVVTWKNGGGIGHVGMVRPGEATNGPALAQAGAKNVNKAHVKDSGTFGNVNAVYYAHP